MTDTAPGQAPPNGNAQRNIQWNTKSRENDRDNQTGQDSSGGLGSGDWVAGQPLVACSSEAETPAVAQQLEDLAGILTSLAGSAAYEALVRSATGATAGANDGIWVSGQGEASASLDLAALNLGIAAFADTVAEVRTSAADAGNPEIQGCCRRRPSDQLFQHQRQVHQPGSHQVLQ